MSKSRVMDIGEVARHSGLAVSTLRFYEEKGLIRSTGRHGLRRLFSSTVLEQLELIALGRYAGFALDEIAAMFGGDGRLQIDRRLLLTRADDLDGTISRLLAVRDGLRHVARCPARNHIECPKFQRLLRLAGKKQSKIRAGV